MRRPRGLPFAALLLLVSALAPARLVAQDDAGRTEEARAAFERGLAAYEAGSFEEALVSFERAYALTENADVLYNVATVADRLRRDDVALDAYERYLAARPETPDRANIEARIAAIRAAHPEAPPPEPSVEPVDDDVVSPPEPTPAPAAPPPARDPGAGPWVLVGVGGAALVGGIVLLGVGAADLDAASRATTWSELSGPYDRVPILTGIGWPLAGVGLALAGAGIGWAIAGSGGSEGTTTVRVGPTGASVEGTF